MGSTRKALIIGGGVMKKIDQFIENVDRRVDQRLIPLMPFFRRYFSVFSATLLGLLLCVVVGKILYNKPYYLSAVITRDLQDIEQVLATIDKDCNILTLVQDRVSIDFLTVKNFAGSMVGGINLAYPDKWKGPYLPRNPMLQGHFYELVKARDGLFVIPGYGTKLPNGKIIGKDVVINKHTEVLPLIQEKNLLNYHGDPLALHVNFTIGDWGSKVLKARALESVNSLLEEFSSALPFAHNTTSNVNV